ncbi:MAG: hypothetical protein O8C56_01190 [Candidatus Methanoperedens sp.]|nr:hypothetical protein [Candidatus Methanoperedens sp.]
MANEQDEKLLTDITIKFADGETDYNILLSDRTHILIQGNYLIHKIRLTTGPLNEVLALRLPNKSALVTFGTDHTWRLSERISYCGYAIWDRTILGNAVGHKMPYSPDDTMTKVMRDMIAGELQEARYKEAQLERGPQPAPYDDLMECKSDIHIFRELSDGLKKYIGGQQPKLQDLALLVKTMYDYPMPVEINEAWLKKVIKANKDAKAALEKADSIISILQQIRASEGKP